MSVSSEAGRSDPSEWRRLWVSAKWVKLCVAEL